MSGPELRVKNLTIAYGSRPVLHDVSTSIPGGSFTAIIGANGCGKSSLLRSMVNLMPRRAGAVLLDGRDVATLRPRDLARQVAMLPQNPLAPDGITVTELTRRGRFAHQGFFPRMTQQDDIAVAGALRDTGLTALADAPVAELSGGQRQRVWIAMVLAQDTPILLLDEPTSFLDLSHQIELMQLLVRLKEQGKTMVAVLHDINQAARYADHLIALADDGIAASGDPAQIVTPDLVRRVFGLDAVVAPDPVSGTPMAIAL